MVDKTVHKLDISSNLMMEEALCWTRTKGQKVSTTSGYYLKGQSELTQTNQRHFGAEDQLC